MKTINKTFVLFLMGMLLLPLSVKVVRAQDEPSDTAATFLEKVESFSTQGQETVTFQYIEVPDRESLSELTRRMTNSSNFPLVVLKKDVFGPGVKIVKTLDLQLLNYELRDQQWQVLDSIHVEKFNKLEEITSLQEARVENYKLANEQLNVQITQLNEQLDSSVELTKKTLRARQIRNLWIGTLGGVFGFSLGVLISAL